MKRRVRLAVLYVAVWPCRATLIFALALFGALAPALPARAQSQTWHVATTGSDVTGDGTAAAPFATIQHAIDTAVHGATVLVQPGVYRENIDLRGKRITVSSLFLTTGNEDYILSTVIDGGRNGHVVSFTSGESATTVLAGLTITNGYASGTSARDVRGGGIFCWETPGPTLTHLRVVGNESASEGGGAFFAHCAPVIRDMTIANNHAGEGGGGVRYSYGRIDMASVIVIGNTSQGDGGGMHFYHADGSIRNVLIADNVGGAKGGGLGFDGASPMFTNVTIAGNWTRGNGGGLNVGYQSRPTLANAIVWGNLPEEIYFDTQWYGQAITVDYSDVRGGEAGIVTNGRGAVNWGAGNLDRPPQFACPSRGDYRLSDGSPAIGAGNADGAPTTDLDGHPRPSPAGSNPDLGAYENRLAAPRLSRSIKCYLPLLPGQ